MNSRTPMLVSSVGLSNIVFYCYHYYNLRTYDAKNRERSRAEVQTGGNTACQQVVELDDRTVVELGVLLAGANGHALAAQHKSVVLAL